MSVDPDWAKELYEVGGPIALIESLSDKSDFDFIEGLDAAMRHAYWQWNDLRGAVMLGTAVMELVEDVEDDEVRAKGKATVANLGIWTWPGWNESERRPTPEMIELGGQAARLNHELAEKLDKPPIAMGRALWTVAAHEMLDDLEEAAETFMQAAEYARQAEADADAKMNEAYALACRRSDSLPSALADLETMGEDGAFYAGQIRTAMKVFGLADED